MADDFDDLDEDFDDESGAQYLKIETAVRNLASSQGSRRVEPAWRKIEILREQRELERLLNYDC